MPTTQSDELERLRLRVAELEGAQQLQGGTDKQLQLEAMVSNASIILFSLDREGVFTLSEGSGLSLLGLEPGQAVGESVFEFFGDHKQIVSECRRAIAGESFHSIVELGDLVFATHYNPILDTDGTIKGTIGVSINITDTHRAQRARDESEAKYRSLVDTAPAIIMTVNRDGEILFINRTVEGYDVKDVIGTNIDDYVSEDQRHAQDDALKKVFETGAPGYYETWREEAWGKAWYSSRIGPVEHDGKIIAATIIVNNVTETHLAHQARDESEAMYRSVVDTAPAFIMTVKQDGEILFINRTNEDFTQEDVIGSNINDYISEDQHHLQTDAINKAFETGQQVGFEISRREPGGNVVWFSSLVGPVEHDGKIIAATIMNTDITDAHLAQQALFESEANYRAVMDNTPAFIITTDLDGRIQFINRTVPDLSIEDVLGTTIFDHLDAEQEAVSRDAISRVIEFGQPVTYDNARADPDGNLAWFSCSAGPIKREGRVVAITVIATDITRQKQAFDALHESEERFRSTFESASIPMAICDEKRGFLKANEAFALLFGYSEDQLRGLKFSDLTFREDRSDGERLFEDLLARQLDHFHIEHRYLTQAGNVVWGNITVSATRDSEDDLRHIVVMLEDITERKRVEQELLAAHADLNLRVEQRTAELTSANVQLREEILERNRVELALRGSETKIRALLDAIPDLMLRIHRDGTFLDYHAKDDSDLALPTSGLTGQIINKVMPLHVAKPVMDRVRAALRTKQLQVFEYDLQSADRVQGTRIQTHEARIVVSGRDEVLVIIRNVTDRRRAEDQATAHQAQLAHVARLNSMGEMATDLAHELNQPLAAIMNYAEHCVREMQGNPNTPEHWIDGANQVINQAERAGKIIKRIRSFVEKREHEDELLQVNETVQNAIDMAATDARHRQVEIELALEPQMSLVRGDAIQIEQVVLNLVRNAIDAMEEAGVENREIIVTTEVVDGQMIQVQVADTGPGLVQTSIDNVFEPFYTTKPDGLGMGLTISRSIVEAHGGKLSVQNNVLTQGASFEFTLPIHPRGESKVPDVERTDRVRGG